VEARFDREKMTIQGMKVKAGLLGGRGARGKRELIEVFWKYYFVLEWEVRALRYSGENNVLAQEKKEIVFRY